MSDIDEVLGRAFAIIYGTLTVLSLIGIAVLGYGMWRLIAWLIR